MSQTLFLSTVTAEFGPLRQRLAALLQRTKKVHVRHQDDFFHRGVKTLQMLEEEIAASSFVVHVIGKEPGWCPPVDQVKEFLGRHQEFARRFPKVAVAGRAGTISATQWEAWLALFLGKRLLSYEFPDRLKPRSKQRQHSKRLHDSHNHPKTVANDDALYDEIIGSLFGLHLLTEQDLHRPVHLPYPSIGTLFRGREKFLEQLRNSLQRAASTAGNAHGKATAITQQAVHGLGGVGKTRLAVEYAWQHADQFSAVLFVTADTPATLQQNLAELTGPLILNLPEASATDESAKVAAALHWLQEHPGWFLIIDNVDSEASADEVERLVAKLHGGQVLITSRLNRWSGSIQPLELDVLDPAAAAGFLLERTDPQKNDRGRHILPTDQADAESIALELDGLALALEQAGAYICRMRISLSDYLAKWKSHARKVQTWHDRTMKYSKSIDITWQTTLDQLLTDEVGLLNILAWLAPDPIPLDIIEHLSPESLCSLRSLWPIPALESTTTIDMRDLLANLADFSMIRWNAQKDEITVHRVVQEILRTQQQEPVPFLTAALNMLDIARPRGNPPDDVRTWAQWDLLRPHVAFAVTEAGQRYIDDPTSVLMGELGALLHGKALHEEAELLKRHALAIDEQSYGAQHPNVARALNNLATLLNDTNRLVEAELLMRRALAIDEQSFGAEHPKVAIRLHNLAALLQATNRLTEAEPLMRRTLAIFEQSYGAEHPKVATNLNNLAQLLQATNRLAEAEPLMRRALAIDEQSYGVEHPNFAVNLNNLAQLLQATNRSAEAEPLVRRALTIFEQSYGAEHPKVAVNLNNLAQLLQATNRLAEAEPLMRRALAIDEQSYGAEHPRVATDLNNLSLWLHAMNRLPEAEPLMRRAVAIDEESYGAEHPDVARDLNNLAQLLQTTNRLAEAEPLMRRALTICEQSYGAEHPKVATSLSNLAQLLQATNRLADAEPLMRRALAIEEQSHGAEHPDVARNLNNLAQLLQTTNRSAEAEPLMRRAVAIFEKSYGAEHPNVATNLSNLAALLQATNRLAEAEPLMRRALAIDEESYGQEHPNVAIRLNNLAVLLRAKYQGVSHDSDSRATLLAEAEPLMRRAVAIWRTSLGDEHPNTLTGQRNLDALLDELK